MKRSNITNNEDEPMLSVEGIIDRSLTIAETAMDDTDPESDVDSGVAAVELVKAHWFLTAPQLDEEIRPHVKIRQVFTYNVLMERLEEHLAVHG